MEDICNIRDGDMSYLRNNLNPSKKKRKLETILDLSYDNKYAYDRKTVSKIRNMAKEWYTLYKTVIKDDTIDCTEWTALNAKIEWIKCFFNLK